jgi:hypothetical protein
MTADVAPANFAAIESKASDGRPFNAREGARLARHERLV